MPLDVGTQVGRYTIGKLLAQGGMAEVYRADQTLTQGITRPVAVKVIRAEYSESADFREMFLDEARTACTLSHPNIVQIYDVGETDDGQLYMAMELVSGETLATINRTLRAHGQRLNEDALFAVGIATASALDAVHALKTEKGTAGLVHRDVSPHNLLVSATGALKLIDFGISKAATNRNLTMPGVTKGKAGYFSPEQAMGKRLDGRSDLFSLGITLYKLASGETPFDAHTSHGERHAALVRGQWKDLAEVFPGLPAPFTEVVRRSLMLKPEERFQTARTMREALEKAAFDAGYRVGQSALFGFVDDDGSIPDAGPNRTAADVVEAAPPRSQARVETAVIPAAARRRAAPTQPAAPAPVQQTKPRKGVFLIAFAAAVIIGVFGTLLVVDLGPNEPVVVAAVPRPVVAKPLPEPEPEPEPVAVAVVDPLPTPEPAPEPMDVSVPVKPTPKKPRPVPAPVKPVEKVEPKPVQPAAEAETLDDGIGTLRIALAGDDSGARVLVRGTKSFEETPPFSNRVPSGVYTVTVRLGNGAISPAWRGPVRADDTRKLTYDVSQQRWNER